MSPADASAPAIALTMVVDVANVMGSRPDGWWRDRAGAATRLLERMPRLVGRTIDLPDGSVAAIARVVAVVEGQAKDVAVPAGIDVAAAPADGDATIVAAADAAVEAGERVLVVTADRGLRARLHPSAATAGPERLNELIGR